MTYADGTRGLILLTVLTWAGWDLFVYHQAGNGATISRVILDSARAWPAVAFAAGVLAGHLFAPQTQP